MAKNLQNEQLEEMGKRRRQGRIMKRVFIGAAVCVAFFAIYALVLPASTLEHPDPACGLEEHVHAEECFETQLTCELPETGAHVHIQACYDANDPEKLVCEEPATGHLHTQKCFAAGDELACENTEADHEHGEDCYLEPGTLVCEEEETVHVHNDACYEVAENLTCTNEDPEHVHGPECTESITTLTCTEESAGHVHHALCYDADGNLTCTEEESVTVDHEHNDACNEQVPACGIEEHQHDEVCYDPETLQMIQATKDNKDAQDAENAEGTEGEDANESEEPEEAEPVDEDELAQLKEQGLAWENENMILTFSLPEDTEEEIRFEVTEQPVDPSELSEEVKNDENAWQNNLQINATKDGEAVEDIASLSASAEMRVKPEAIEPILSEIDFDKVAPEIQDEVGAEITVKQTLADVSKLPISERPQNEPIRLVATNANSQAIMFDLRGSQVSTQAMSPINVEFTVTYSAAVDLVLSSTEAKAAQEYQGKTIESLPMIDTSGKRLPENGKPASGKSYKNAIKDFGIYQLGETSDENLGYGNKYGESYSVWGVTTQKVNKPVYKDKQFNFFEAPNLTYFNVLASNKGYEIDEIIIKHGVNCSNNQEEETTFKKEDIPSLHFTNNIDSVSDGYVLIDSDTTININYKCVESQSVFKSDMFDYDITNAGTPLNAVSKGINSKENYNGEGAKYAFGNSKGVANTGLGEQKAGLYFINRANSTDLYNNDANAIADYGCSFGIVRESLNDKGEIQFSEGIVGPDIFGKSSEDTGKTNYIDQYGLVFNQDGDTYTLEAVKSNKDTGVDEDLVVANLGQFLYRTNWNKTKDIYSNDFWALDNAKSHGTPGHDPLHGVDAVDVQGAEGKTGKLPTADFGGNHNGYFGVQYDVDFTLDENYVGPLEYYFYGDDDMWVYLDGTLICDIGGVHSSFGEYVNLWDYVGQACDNPSEAILQGCSKGKCGDGEKHTLKFFYTERGASGSTCYMRFTLPSVESAKRHDTSALKIEKRIEGNVFSVDDEFEFDVALKDADGNYLPDAYSYTIFNEDKSPASFPDLIFKSKEKVTLKAGQYIVIKYLPKGARFEVVENNYKPTIEFNGEPLEGTVATGTITGKDEDHLLFVNSGYMLPETGGVGQHGLVLMGLAIVLTVGLFELRHHKAFYRKKHNETA